MQPDQQHLAGTYQHFSDVEIAALHSQVGSLTDEARSALDAEIRRRGLEPEHLSKLAAAERRHEDNFDRLAKFHRKRVANYLLFRNDPKGTLVVIAVGVLLALIALLFDRRH